MYKYSQNSTVARMIYARAYDQIYDEYQKFGRIPFETVHMYGFKWNVLSFFFDISMLIFGHIIVNPPTYDCVDDEETIRFFRSLGIGGKNEV